MINGYVPMNNVPMNNKLKTGLNGFGRFGLRLFRHWLLHRNNALFSIDYINDPFKTAAEIAQEIKSDGVAGTIPHTVTAKGNTILINNTIRVHVSSHTSISDITWHGDVALVFECSGKFTERRLAAQHLNGMVQKVLISATTFSADALIILGVNDHEYIPEHHHIISYGSCTLNAYLPIAKILNDAYGIQESQVHVTHSTPLRSIKKPFGSILGKPCTLEYAAPLFFPQLKDNFFVQYRMIPYPGVSLMDMCFKLKKKPSVKKIISLLEQAARGAMDMHVWIEKKPKDSNYYINDPHSAIIRSSEIRSNGDYLLISSWFDNENSATRIFDLAHFVIRKNKNHQQKK